MNSKENVGLDEDRFRSAISTSLEILKAEPLKKIGEGPNGKPRFAFPQLDQERGADTSWADTLDTLRPRGLMVSFGNASGPVTGVSLSMLQSRGSLYVTRPTGAAYVGSKDQFRRSIAAVFEALETGKIHPRIDQRFTLAAIEDAHRALEARETTGASVIIP